MAGIYLNSTNPARLTVPVQENRLPVGRCWVLIPGGGQKDFNMKSLEMLFILLRGVNHRFRSHLACPEKSPLVIKVYFGLIMKK